MTIALRALLLTAVLLPLAACASSSEPAADGTVMLKVSGMSCPIRCPAEVKTQLEAVPGVLGARVDYPAKRATCDVEPGTDADTVAEGLQSPYAGTPVSR